VDDADLDDHSFSSSFSEPTYPASGTGTSTTTHHHSTVHAPPMSIVHESSSRGQSRSHRSIPPVPDYTGHMG
jgi:hypothetical protein